MRAFASILVLCCLIFAGCSDDDAKTLVTAERRENAIRTLDLVYGGMHHYRYAGLMQQVRDAKRRVESIPQSGLSAPDVLIAYVMPDDGADLVVAQWIADIPTARVVRLEQAGATITLPMSQYNIEANDADATSTILFYAEVRVGANTPESESLRAMIDSTKPMRTILLDKDEQELGEAVTLVVDPNLADPRAVLTAPDSVHTDAPILAAVFDSAPDSLRPGQWQPQVVERLTQWLNDEIVGRRIELRLHYESIEVRDGKLHVQLAVAPPVPNNGSATLRADGRTVELVHANVHEIVVPFDPDLHSAMAADAVSGNLAPLARFEIMYFNVLTFDGSWAMDVGLSHGEFVELPEYAE